MKTKTKK